MELFTHSPNTGAAILDDPALVSLQSTPGVASLVSAQDEEELRALNERAALERATGMTAEEWDQTCQSYMFGNEPDGAHFDKARFDELLQHCTKIGASDIDFATDEPVLVEISGLYFPVTKRRMTSEDMNLLIGFLYGEGGTSLVAGGKDIDSAYDIRLKERYRFRVNITGILTRGQRGVQITLRTIKGTPMRLSQMGVEQGIMDRFKQPNGLVVICGPTGSGKSSLLAGMMVSYLEDAHSHRKILTYESPIEYVYDSIPARTSRIYQSEIGSNLSSFAAGVRNSLRRAPKIILLGESRDAETMEASLQAAETGHTLYTTVHANNTVGETIYRMVNMFTPEERNTKMHEIIEALRMVVVQRLERTITGGRTAMREYLYFSTEIREELRQCTSLREVVVAVGGFVDKYGQTMTQCAQRKFNEGLLSADVLHKYTHVAKAAAKLGELTQEELKEVTQVGDLYPKSNGAS